MQYARLGSSGLKVSHLALGCLSFSTDPAAGAWTSDDEAATVEGEPPADWAQLFATTAPDHPGSLDGAADPAGPPLAAEPPRVRRDVEVLQAR
jgi:hypothetical protein